MSNFPKFAVVLAAHNGSKFILEQIDSIVKQKNVIFHLFINVDKSIDGTEMLLINKFLGHPFITILPTGNSYGGAALNFYHLLIDIDFVGFDYFSFADQDDIWYPEKLWRAHSLLIQESAMGYSSNVMAFWSNGESGLVNKSQAQRRWDFLFEAAGPGCTYVMRQDLALAIQNVIQAKWDLVQNMQLHDWLVYAFARTNNYKWLIDSQPSMLYRQHADNQVGVNLGWRAFKYRVGKVLSGWGMEQAAIVASVLNLDETSFVRRWKSGGRLGLLWLALNANQCRRRKRDRVFFALSCVALAFLGRIHKS